ncbi:MAG: hypothetical protein A3C85_02625 [Candidatus Doudnabacteria bacterium RIFCSPHIGHO2_02_FULL_48_21]|uniref:Uncharacterized protein n=1 Tax=Candidatus Doudnabacteria bacterium RIFCSPLOWO2_02_FULL_48_13 TaxID=1817845 RepID=A0A1F5QAW0_9BACT|nr:MAG: hypothetical protein A3K05_03905 [Candidatus Doudnabacteria bacterium RIFCSPHIGHO2_01_48_18]OGE78723.1 MAG: hypothetical protein A2668_04135 [Candidatus Doudnabacteria bacterium RIFCSPHIGHO2_01_FULL_48_180]OGE91407.1 MAG: hypothetical protein A3F44_00615 [Candidatus Doudnabacteria bacterium RIFCSPHIGHO2_12_FULL_47_25]OGE93898.1 MAG: hypothetical protein A3C85_02625 [Candidatus Doudnabacteria bacterium RIFCSPHIGHO2_02_FULL_48_21]OGE97877.1 MAG: hypothetical protein A3A83_02980 [Candidatu
MVKEFLKSLREGMKQFADMVADSVNLLLLLAVYFVGIGLVSIVAKLSGKHFLDIGRQSRQSYWQKIEKRPERNSFYRMF